MELLSEASRAKATEEQLIAAHYASAAGADPAPEPEPEPFTRTVETQSDYRESEAQTVPWEPEYRLQEHASRQQQALCQKHHCTGPELLTLRSALSASRGSKLLSICLFARRETSHLLCHWCCLKLLKISPMVPGPPTIISAANRYT